MGCEACQDCNCDNVTLPVTQGPAGASVLTGSGVPSTSLGKDGDSYIDLASTDQDFYTRAAGVWTDTGVNLKGATGAAGADGADGDDGMTFDTYVTGDLGFFWSTLTLAVEQNIPTFDRTAPTTGNYQVHGTFGQLCDPGTQGEIRLYVNNVLVIKQIVGGSAGGFTDDWNSTVVILWRGAVTAGDLIDIRFIRTSGAGGATLTGDYGYLINKEA